MDHGPQRWKADYDRDGYLVVPNLVDPQTLALLRAGIDRIADDPEAFPPRLRHRILMERDFVKGEPKYNDLNSEQVGNAVHMIMELPLFDQVFGDLIFYQPLLDVLEVLFESREYHFHNYKCVYKAPRVSSAFKWHRDLPYLQHSTPNLITAILCLDEMTAENGATAVLPGTHRIPHDQVKPSDVDIPEENLPTDVPRVSVCCPAGSAVLFHVNILHGGPPNRSDIPRRNVIGIWAGPRTYPTNPHRWAYQDIYPLSSDPDRQKQVRMSFPHLFDEKGNRR